MLKIELRNRKEKDDSKYIVVNGIEDKDSSYYHGKYPSLHLYNEEVTDILIAHSFKEIGEHLTQLYFSCDFDWWDNTIQIEILCNKYFKDKFPSIKINLQLQDWEHWAKPWSMASVAKQFEINLAHQDKKIVKYWQDDEDSILNGFGVEYFPSSDCATVETELDNILSIVEKLAIQTNQELLSSADHNAVVTFYQFPNEAKTACKQYLLYFAQFLADIGIEADTEIKEELNYTLFKVIPSDKDESLELIRQALTVYLQAPSNNNLPSVLVNNSDIAIKQWEANIFHLKSQLALAASIIQVKETAIEMLQLTNYQYKQQLELHSNNKDKNKEEIIKGIVAVDKFESKGFEINLAEIIRLLKRRFGK